VQRAFRAALAQWTANPTAIKNPKKTKKVPASAGDLPCAAVKSILLAEDSQDDAFLFLKMVRQSQLTNPIIVVRDGAETIACLNLEGEFGNSKKFPPPSVLFLDLKMPKVSGIEVLRWVKTQPHLDNLLRIILTHHQNVKDVNHAYELGAHSFLIKPLSQAELFNLVLHFQSHFHGCCGTTGPGQREGFGGFQSWS
jgi:CheY-like chemotaxis protein